MENQFSVGLYLSGYVIRHHHIARHQHQLHRGLVAYCRSQNFTSFYVNSISSLIIIVQWLATSFCSNLRLPPPHDIVTHLNAKHCIRQMYAGVRVCVHRMSTCST